MKRITICSFLTLVMVLSMLTGCSGNNSGSSVKPTTNTASGSLVFPKDNYTVETTTVTTSGGTKQVTYHLYQHITYVANPVDANYESMDVSVPVKIDGVDIDATNAPILFNINVAGYMSSSNTGSGTGGAPGGGAAPSGSMGAPPGGMGAFPGGGTPPGGGLPPGGGPPSGGGPPPGGGPPGGNSNVSNNTDLALAAGYVVVSPGCRGRDNQAADGTYYGKAPAAIVDLKCAVRYIRNNAGVMPGNANWIISTGSSAGGALSALLGASGNSDLYDAYFKELGAAEVDDNIYASASYSAITDLDHADMAYEWMFGTTPLSSGQVDQTLSQQLKDEFTDYQASLNLKVKNGFGTITADNYADYLLQAYLVPSANKYLSTLSDTDRASYLAKNTWITWANNTASFTFADYLTHIGRMKGLPAFDDFNLAQAENILFGNATTNARHFTDFSLRYTSGNSSAEVDSDLKTVVNLMNPMYFIGQKNSGCAGYWWIRNGTLDNNTSLTVGINLATSLENLNKQVNTWLYWDGGHAVNEDPEDFIAWVGNITGYTR